MSIPRIPTDDAMRMVGVVMMVMGVVMMMMTL